MWIKLSKWTTWQNYVIGVLEMEQFPLQLWRLIFQLSECLVHLSCSLTVTCHLQHLISPRTEHSFQLTHQISQVTHLSHAWLWYTEKTKNLQTTMLRHSAFLLGKVNNNNINWFFHMCFHIIWSCFVYFNFPLQLWKMEHEFTCCFWAWVLIILS